MSKTNLLFTIILLLFALSANNYSQNFKVFPLIEIPGDNIQHNILSPQTGRVNRETYICWINKLDSIYTVYLKQISPIIGENIVVSTDSNIKANPQIALNRYNLGIKIVWQHKINNYWKVYLRNYNENQLSEPILILDSLQSDPQISLSTHRLAWIDSKILLFKEFYPDLSEAILLDTLNSSNPELFKYDFLQSTQILYEKGYGDSVKVILLNYQDDREPKSEYMYMSNGLMSKNPKFGMNLQIAFQAYENDVWKSMYAQSSYRRDLITTENDKCNYYNPILFTYPIPTSSTVNKTPFFLAFDSDSLLDNNEIFIKTFYYGMYDSLLNISQCEGNDFKPIVAYTSTIDSIFISIIWLHSESGKTDIWMAKDNFNSLVSNIENENQITHSFKLYQNYPNPFNPSTTIEYRIENPNDVKIIIYDLMGKQVKILVNEYKNTGYYKEQFNASHLSSGTYYYQIVVGSYIQTRAMLLVK